MPTWTDILDSPLRHVEVEPTQLVNRSGLRDTLTKYGLQDDEYWVHILKDLDNNFRTDCECEFLFAQIVQLKADGAAKRSSMPSAVKSANKAKRTALEADIVAHDLRFHKHRDVVDFGLFLETLGTFDRNETSLDCLESELDHSDLLELNQITTNFSDSVALNKQLDLLEISSNPLVNVEDCITQVLDLKPWTGVHDEYYTDVLSLDTLKDLIDQDVTGVFDVCWG